MLNVALLDLNNNEPNRGIGMLQVILDHYHEQLQWVRYDVRHKNQIPNITDYDIFVCSGGPGDPLHNDGPWFERFFQFLTDLRYYNEDNANDRKKYCLFICHSFQMACHHYGIGTISERNKYSFGTFPVHKTHEGKEEQFFHGLPDPFYIADFRRYQVLQPNLKALRKMGGTILCLEKHRPHTDYERAIMAVRFSPYMFGTQFHPEANPEGLLTHFVQPERHQQVLDTYGESTYLRMIRDLANPRKIGLTFETIIPNFLDHAIEALAKEAVLQL